MLVYIFMAVFPLLLSAFLPKVNTNDKNKRKFLIILGFVVVFFMGLRSRGVGGDDPQNYYRMMERAIAADSWREYYAPDFVESGFQFFVYVISRVLRDPQFLFIVTSIIMVGCMLYCIYKNSDNVVLSSVMYITLGLMQFQMQGMRQAIAMAICMVAFEFVKEKKLIPFVLLVVLATQIHRTAIVFIAVYFVAMLSYNWLSMLLLAIGSVVVFANMDSLMAFANDVFETDYAQTIDSGGFVATAIYVLIIVFSMLFNRNLKNKKSDRYMAPIMFITILGFISYIMRYFGAGISERISFYFMFGQLILLPNTLTVFKGEKKIMNAIVYVLCIGLFIYRLRGSAFVPYEFFWSY